MSAAEMTANGGKISAGVAKLVDEAVDELLAGQRLLLDLQREVQPAALHSGETKTVSATDIWLKLESIDDRIHNALAKLGA